LANIGNGVFEKHDLHVILSVSRPVVFRNYTFPKRYLPRFHVPFLSISHNHVYLFTSVTAGTEAKT